MIENVSTQLTVFHCFAHCLLPGRAFASLYVLLFLEKEAEIGGRVDNKAETEFLLLSKVLDTKIDWAKQSLLNFLKMTIFSSPEPKALGELIV